MIESLIAAGLVLIPATIYHVWMVRRLHQKLAETRETAKLAYATGVEHGTEQTHAQRDTEAEAMRRRAYNAGFDAAKAQPKRQRADAA